MFFNFPLSGQGRAPTTVMVAAQAMKLTALIVDSPPDHQHPVGSKYHLGAAKVIAAMMTTQYLLVGSLLLQSHMPVKIRVASELFRIFIF